MIKHDKVIVEFAGLDTTTYLFFFILIRIHLESQSQQLL